MLSAISRGVAGVAAFLLALVVLILSGFAISSALQVVDRKTIATFRRTMALLMGGEILWLLVVLPGAAYYWLTGTSSALTNALLFGAIAASGFEFLIINGAFQRNPTVSLVLALVHPASTILILRLPELTAHFDYAAALFGALALILIVAFPFLMKRRRTSLGTDALSLFQAFMRTWAAGQSDDLESIIGAHSEEVEVTTKVMRFRTKDGDKFLVLPGVHPGPFHPVGSYDLPGVMTRAFRELGPVMTFHRPGGHERNVATRAETRKYAQDVFELGKSVDPTTHALLRGPVHSHVGRANVSALSFDRDLVVTISFAPLGSDDIDTQAESDLAARAADSGFDLSVVDAHNSIDPDLQSPDVGDPGWRQVFELASQSTPTTASAAYAHSSELGFAGRGDLTENGIGLLMLATGGVKSVLVLADANNSVPRLRELVSKALGDAGYGLIEFCTSDSHNLAARGLTVERGYEALGEATPPETLTEAVVKMAKLAEARLAQAEYGSASMKSRVRVFGSRALEEFAAITQESSKFSRSYFRLAVAGVVGLLVAAIFL